MSGEAEGPVMAAAALNRTLSNERPGRISDVRPSGRRRIFVQTDNGSVLGVELDRGDNAHTVKRRIQLELNVPTTESSLTFGDLVIKNDLSTIRNGSPLLLKRPFMQRSSSTPCLSPTGKDIRQRDQSGSIEILGLSSKCFQTKQLVKDIVEAIKSGIEPKPVSGGLGGAYYFKNAKLESIAIVKPTDEEPFAPNNPKGFVGKALGQPGLKRSVRVGETGFREVAAYLLDYDHFANVPPTVLVKITHSVFHVNEVNGGCKKANVSKPKKVSKMASLQQFVPHDYDASDHGTSSFPVASVHRIGILDVRTFNTDRHAGNLLVRKLNGVGKFGGSVELIPIDHGLCLPETLEDPYFEWVYWPQASIPFSEDELEYIAKLDPKKDADLLRMELPMIREACLRVLVLCTVFLKEAAGFGLCLSEIGEMMSRAFNGSEEEPSELEVVCLEAKRLIGEGTPSSLELESGEEFQFDLDCEDDFLVSNSSPSRQLLGLKTVSARNPFSRLESMKEEDENFDEAEGEDSSSQPATLVPKLSTLLKGFSFSGKSQHSPFGGLKGFKLNSKNNSGDNAVLRSYRSAKEQTPSSSSFVKFTDMDDQEWTSFLEKFQELLSNAFEERKRGATASRQRLGTSCQF